MNIQEQIQQLDLGAIVELFEVDTTVIGGVDHFYFHSGTNELNGPVVWKGVTYNPFPIQAEGFDKGSRGALPRPRMRVANANSIVSAICDDLDDLVGAKVIRRRTFVRYLDAVNFVSGNLEADPNQAYPDDVFFVERKVDENPVVVEFELSSAMDLQGVQLPSRDITAQVCSWDYRRWNSATSSFDYTHVYCPYVGTSYFDIAGSPVADPALDVCSKQVGTGCKVRFAGDLPFGGFPAAKVYKL